MNINEGDSLGGFDVGDFLSALDSDISIGKKIGDASGPQSLENELTEEEKQELRRFQVDFLSRIFPNINSSTRELAQKFKVDFDSNKYASAISTHISSKVRTLIMRTTIDNLAQTALEEHQTYIRLSGQAVPDSIEARSRQAQAFRWEKIHEIVKAASEIKD